MPDKSLTLPAGDQSRIIGRVSSVDSELVMIELATDSPGYVKAMSSGIASIGAINSYVTIPVGSSKIIAVVTAIRIVEQVRSESAQYAISQATLRLLEATMIGRLEQGQYRAGIASYPSLFAPVSAATAGDVARIFKAFEGAVVRLGEAVVAPGQDVLLHANTLLARHCAVLGSTGSGKSCSVTTVLDELLSLDIPSASIVIFDANGEYATAFRSGERANRANVCIIGGFADTMVDLNLPHWFMDNAEHMSLFQAGEGAQAPILQRAVADARLEDAATESFAASLITFGRSVEDARKARGEGRKPQESISYALEALRAFSKQKVARYAGTDEVAIHEFWNSICEALTPIDQLGLLRGNDAWDRQITAEQSEKIDELLSRLIGLCHKELSRIGLGTEAVTSDFDAPRYYSLERLVRDYIPRRIEIETANEPRIRAYIATLLMRISRLLADSRYDFFTRNPRHDNALAAFLRLILGWSPNEVASGAPWREQYERATAEKGTRHSVTIVDLSRVAPEILEHVTALIARIIMDFAQRLEPRASIPILLVLEEAHRYVPAVAPTKFARPSEVFERIAKEGRKYGISILLASQRPSELSRTVLAQCGTLIAHRIVNADDQDIIRHATPFAGRDVLRQLPGLATQHAIVVGEAAPAPTYVRIRDIPNPPRSADPNFIGLWQRRVSSSIPSQIDAVASAWEAGAFDKQG